jgi:hypothetical protein
MLNSINISSSKQKLIVYAVLTVVTLAVFWQVNHFGFINMDDDVYVVKNSHVLSGMTCEGFKWAFSTRYFDLWTPLVWLSYMLDYQLYGLNAGGYHLTNLILHIMSVLLLFWLFNRMTHAVWKSAFVAAFFAIHPLRIESVVWIAERKDVLSVFFWMLTLCLYVLYTEKAVVKRYLLVVCSFILALMSKPMVVTLPFIMILLDFWPLQRFESKKGQWVLWQLKEKILFFMLSAVVIIITLYKPNYTPPERLSLGSRLLNSIVALMAYLEKTFWPHDPVTLFAFSGRSPLLEVMICASLIIVISAVVTATRKRCSYFFVGWLWYIITIAPVIGIIQIGMFGSLLISDHYTYLPSIGIAVMVSWGIPLFFKNDYTRKRILFPASIATVAVLAFLTWQQCSHWRNSFELSDYYLHVTPNNNTAHALAHHIRGVSYFEIEQYQQASKDFNEVVRLIPQCAECYFNRANAYNGLGRLSLAIEDYNEAIRLMPNFTHAYYFRSIAYKKLGMNQQAIEDYNYAVRLGLLQRPQQ